MWAYEKIIKAFLTNFMITFTCVGWAYLLNVGAIVAQSRAALFVDCAVASAISALLWPRVVALLPGAANLPVRNHES
jgi:hypothetical protein